MRMRCAGGGWSIERKGNRKTTNTDLKRKAMGEAHATRRTRKRAHAIKIGYMASATDTATKRIDTTESMALGHEG
jgi:hypothetical protein